jgi:hypothetical protein
MLTKRAVQLCSKDAETNIVGLDHVTQFHNRVEAVIRSRQAQQGDLDGMWFLVCAIISRYRQDSQIASRARRGVCCGVYCNVVFFSA